MNFYEILNNLCAANGTTVTGLLKELNISTSKGTAWKNGSIPNLKVASALAERLNVTTDYLLGREDRAERFIKENAVPVDGEWINLPIYGVVRAGIGGVATEELLGHEMVQAHDIKGKGDCFWLKVKAIVV